MSSIRVIDNFVSQEDCKEMIGFLDYMQSIGELHTMPVGRFGLWNSKHKPVKKVIKKYTKIIANIVGQEMYPHICGIVKYEKGGSCEEHIDVAEDLGCQDDLYSAVLYFNDNYEGGEIYFPKLDEEYHPFAGSLIFYPGTFPEYLHGVREVTSGQKYIMPMCFTPHKKLSPRHLRRL